MVDQLELDARMEDSADFCADKTKSQIRALSARRQGALFFPRLLQRYEVQGKFVEHRFNSLFFMLSLLVTLQLSDYWRIVHPDVRILQNKNNSKCALYVCAYNYLPWFQKSTHERLNQPGSSWLLPKEYGSEEKGSSEAPGHPSRQAKADPNNNLHLEAMGLVHSLQQPVQFNPRQGIAHLHLTVAVVSNSGLGSSLSSLGNLH